MLRLVVSGIGVWLGFNAVLMMDCGHVGVVWPPEGSIWVCFESETTTSVPGLWAAVGMLAVAMLVFGLVWLPVLIRMRRDTTTSLAANIGRVAADALDAGTQQSAALDRSDPESNSINNTASRAHEQEVTKPSVEPSRSGSSPDSDNPASATTIAGRPANGGSSTTALTRSVEILEQVWTSETLSPQSASKQWIGLLREANQLHNNGQLPTDEFSRMNTRLLELVARPDDSST